MLLKDLKLIFHKELDSIYGNHEVASIFFLCTDHYLDLPKFQLALQPEFTLTKSETNQFFEALEHLKHEKPIQYIIGETEFYGLKIKVNTNVLIPRPETEELVDLIIKDHNDRSKNSRINILDIGTGSGCIAIALAKNLLNSNVHALDVSLDVLEVAKQNAILNDVDVNFLKRDILRVSPAISKIENSDVLNKESYFDVIVSNPPYVRNLEKKEIRNNVLDNEPHLALFVDDENTLLFYKAIVNLALRNLKSNGNIYFEINQYLGKETKELLDSSNFCNVELIKDLNGNERMIKATKK